MVIVTLHLKVAPEKRLNTLKTIHAMIGPTSVEPGCLHCGFYSSTQNDDELMLLEKWESQAHLERHLRSDDFRKLLAAMETANEPPEISFNKVGSIEGMEMVEALIG